MKQLLFALFVLTASFSAIAQPVGVEITPMVGFRTGGTIAYDVTNVFGDDVKTDDSATFGLIVDIDLSRYWQLELLANHQKSDLEYRGNLFEPDIQLGDMDVTYWHVGINYRYIAGNVHPFIGLTVGGATLDPKLEGLDSENRFSGSLGGGVKVFLHRNIGIRLEGRGYWTSIDERSATCCNGYWSQDEDFLQAEASVGVIFAF
jgi:opacity protein-like surface antigen